MTTDTTALQERIARVLHGIDPILTHGHDWRNLSDAERKFYIRKAAAVLPIIAAEVRKAQGEAWTDCVAEASALGWLHADAALDMLDRNPHEETP